MDNLVNLHTCYRIRSYHLKIVAKLPNLMTSLWSVWNCRFYSLRRKNDWDISLLSRLRNLRQIRIAL